MGYLTGVKTQFNIKDTGHTCDNIIASYLIGPGPGFPTDMYKTIAVFSWYPTAGKEVLVKKIMVFITTNNVVAFSSQYGSAGGKLGIPLNLIVSPSGNVIASTIDTMLGWFEHASSFMELSEVAPSTKMTYIIKFDLQNKFGGVKFSGGQGLSIETNEDMSLLGLTSQKIKVYGVNL